MPPGDWSERRIGLYHEGKMRGVSVDRKREEAATKELRTSKTKRTMGKKGKGESGFIRQKRPGRAVKTIDREKGKSLSKKSARLCLSGQGRQEKRE